MIKERSKQGWLARLGKAATCFALTGCVALACGGNTDDDNATGSIESVDDLLREIAVSLCRGDCNEAVAAELEYTYGRDCLEVFTLVYESLGASLKSSLDAGKASLDAAAAQRCIDLRAADNCAESAQACNDAIVGQVPVGGACTSSDECAGNANCSLNLECPGTCVATGGPGDPCTDDPYWCGGGFYCSPDEGVCRAVKANGEPCDNPDECLSSNCDLTGEENRCADRPPNVRLGAGEPCSSDVECELDVYCHEGTCTPAAALGETCEPYIVPCAREAYCAIDSGAEEGVCVERIPLGGACESSAECATGVCDGGTCQKHSGLGGACVTDERCFGVCEDGKCAPYSACALL